MSWPIYFLFVCLVRFFLDENGHLKTSIDHSDSYWPVLTTFWHIDRSCFNRLKPLVKTGDGFDPQPWLNQY